MRMTKERLLRVAQEGRELKAHAQLLRAEITACAAIGLSSTNSGDPASSPQAMLAHLERLLSAYALPTSTYTELELDYLSTHGTKIERNRHYTRASRARAKHQAPSATNQEPRAMDQSPAQAARHAPDLSQFSDVDHQAPDATTSGNPFD